jgi:hypothetical protein
MITDGPVGDEPLVGPIDLWVETLTSWVLDLGIDALIFSPSDFGTRGIERFAAEIAPAVRAAISAH